MIPAELPRDERQRLAELYALGLLDTDADHAFDEVTRLAQRLLHTPIALVSLVDADRQWFKSRQGVSATETARDAAFCAHAILDDGVFVVENATEDPRFEHNPLVIAEPSIRFYAGAPLRGPAGHRLGTLCVIDDEPRHPSDEDLETLQDLAAIVEKEIARASTAVTDPLTGLHNRRGFLAAGRQILAAAARSGEPMVLAYADVDGLKSVNDTDGHGAGDRAICTAADLLRRNVRDADILARLGGDEFALLLYGADGATARTPLRRLRARVDDHNAIAEERPLSLSVGWVEWDGGESLDELLDRADRAMYEAKGHSEP